MPRPNTAHPDLQEGGTYFCPTALASTLCGGGVGAAAALSPTGLAASGGGGGYVIVETNFRASGEVVGQGQNGTGLARQL